MVDEIKFNEEELAQVEKYKSQYPEDKAAIMPVLWLAQKKWGWLSSDVMQYVGDLLNLPYSHVKGVVSFYTMYFDKPMGKYHIQVCTNISCMLRGGENIYKHVSEKLGVNHNERTEDGLFSLEEVECLGACGGAPMIAINEDYYENVDIEEVDRIIKELE